MRLFAALGALVAALVVLALTPQWALGAHARDTEITKTLPSPRQVEQRILSRFGVSRGPRAVRIARCESRTPRRPLNPLAVGAAGERGLFQIHPIHFGQPARRGSRLIIRAARLFDADYNIRVAFEMSGGGRYWGAWSCARRVG